MGDVAAGWYDDGSGRQRWWDGTGWTSHFASDSRENGESTGLNVTTGPILGAPGWHDDQRGRLRFWDGQQWTLHSRFSGNQQSFGMLAVDGEWIHFQDASQPIAGAFASYESAGDVGNRSTLTRAAVGGVLLGPAGLIAGAMFKKNVDRREFYITVDGPEQVWVAPVPARLGSQARQFVAWINSVSRQLMKPR